MVAKNNKFILNDVNFNATKSLVALLQRPLPGAWILSSEVERLLILGANPNVKNINQEPILHELIQKDIFKQHKDSVELLVQYGADIHQVNQQGHNALSLALTLDHMPAALSLMSKGSTIPTTKVDNGFYQAINLILTKKPVTDSDFIDINYQNKKGLTALHVACQLKDSHAVKMLISSGANPLLKDNLGRTPLKIAEINHNTDVIKTIIDHYLENHKDILKFSDFTLFKAKDDGISKGGFYHDKNHEDWLLKGGHSSNVESIVKEYIAGALYQLLLGEKAPQTEIVIDNLSGEFLTGSKLIPGFKTLDAHHVEFKPSFPVSLDNKPIKGFMDAMCAIQFMADTDAHSRNVGLVNKGDHYAFIKIDHGFSFNYKHKFGELTLDSFRDHVRNFYNLNNFEKIGFDAVYQSISKIGNLAFSEIEQVVSNKINAVKTRMKILELTDLHQGFQQINQVDLDKNLHLYQQDLLHNLKDQQQDFKKIAQYMTLEKAIIDHDVKAVSSLFTQGVNLQTPFKPFYNPIKFNWMGVESTTGVELAKKHWPNLLEHQPKALQKNNAVIAVEDVIAPNNDLWNQGENAVHSDFTNPLDQINQFIDHGVDRFVGFVAHEFF